VNEKQEIAARRVGRETVLRELEVDALESIAASLTVIATLYVVEKAAETGAVGSQEYKETIQLLNDYDRAEKSLYRPEKKDSSS